jgi:hypothetical protein
VHDPRLKWIGALANNIKKSTFDNSSKEAFLAKEWNSFHLSGKKLDDLHMKDFLGYECELCWKQSMTSP